MDIKVRPANLDDLDELFKIHASDAKYGRRLETYPVMEWFFNSNIIFLVAEKKKPIGFMIVRLAGEDAKIDFLSVHKRAKETDTIPALLDTAEKMLIGYTVRTYVPALKKEMDVFLKRKYELKNRIPHLFGARDGALLVKSLRSKKTKILQRPRPAPEAVEEKPAPVEGSYLEENIENLDEYIGF